MAQMLSVQQRCTVATVLSPVWLCYTDPHNLSYQVILMMAKFTGIRPRRCRNIIELDVRVADEHNSQSRETENSLLEHLRRGRETVREGRHHV